MLKDFQENISIYVHWPFCTKKCPYCDFNSHEINDKINHENWKNAFAEEISLANKSLNKKNIKSIFFGGGTPSLMPVELIEFILNKFSNFCNIDKNIEISLEANPSSTDSKNFNVLSKIGINRLSLGFQSLNDQTLKFLGRTHSSLEAKKGLEIAKKYFKRVSLDLIYGTPEQKISSWIKELKEATSIAGEHISAYQLTIEKGTKFFLDFKNQKFTLPIEDTLLNLGKVTDSILLTKGYNKYEISNYSYPNAECMHNLDIWRGLPYIGIGPGAHGRIIKNNHWHITQKFSSPDKWLNSLLNGKDRKILENKISNNERAKEIILTSLRLKEGINLNRLKILTNIKSLENVFDNKAITELCKLKLIYVNDSHIKLTPEGFPLLNVILHKMLK